MRRRLLTIIFTVGLATATLGGVPVGAEVIPHWTEPYEVPGRIVDVTPTALLYVDSGGVLHHVDRHEVDQRPARAQLHQADGVLAPLEGAAEHVAVERHHCRFIAHPQHHVVDLLQRERRLRGHGMRSGREGAQA